MIEANKITEKLFEIINNYIYNTNNGSNSIIEYKTPNELKELFDFHIKKEGEDFDEIIKYIEQYLNYSVNTGNHQFFNQLYGGFNLPAFMGEIITALSNTSIYTYEVAPVATLIEKELISKMCKIVGYPDGDGIFVTGGSNANLIAMFSARNKLYPNVNTDGIFGLPKLTAFVSEQAHYSFENNANVLGIGSKQVYKIKSDESGKMIPEDLEKQIKISIEKNEKPFFIAATAATTVHAAIDPIEEIIAIAKKYDIWIHVDGSFGGSLILSTKAKELFKGVEKSNSFAWDPHKLMNIPLVCSVILINDNERLYKNLTKLNDDYIFHDTETGTCDLGKKSIQCGRKVDALKLWLSWKHYGDEGYTNRINNLLEIAEYFEQKIISDSNFELVVPRQTLTVCFRYIPKNITDIEKINEEIREVMRKSGKTIVNFGYINNKFVYRWVVANAETTKKDVDIFFDNFYEVANQLDN
jgi:glutamate/tyrosine decarboxylase-like PLP-dependent enzyme